VEHSRPTPPVVTPSRHVQALRARGLPRRRDPLGAIMVIVVLSVVIALVAAMAFGTVR
jgi:hypothetical protein